MNAWMWILIVFAIVIAYIVISSVVAKRRRERDFEELKGLAAEHTGGKNDEGDEESYSPAQERRTIRARVSELGASVRRWSWSFDKYLPVFTSFLLTCVLVFWLANRISSIANRTTEVEIGLASKADTTEVQELATRVTTQEGETKSLAESMTKLTELVETVYSKAVNASTAAEDARTKAEKAASAAASVKKYATKVEARVAKLEVIVNSDLKSSVEADMALEKQISASDSTASAGIKSVADSLAVFKTASNSATSGTESRLQNLEQKLAKCKMKK